MREVRSGGARWDKENEAALWLAHERARTLDSRERLFSHYAQFARNVARRYHRERSKGDIDISDLSQYAYTGLLEAIDRFDPGKGVPFRGFAVRRIAGSIEDGIAHQSEVLEQINWRKRMRRERMASLKSSGSETKPLVEQLAEMAVGLALGYMLEDTGLLAGFSSSQPLAAASCYDSAIWNETIQNLQHALAALPEKEKTVLVQHYLHGVSFDRVARLLQLSPGRVSQLHHAGLKRLRLRLTQRHRFELVR